MRGALFLVPLSCLLSLPDRIQILLHITAEHQLRVGEGIIVNQGIRNTSYQGAR